MVAGVLAAGFHGVTKMIFDTAEVHPFFFRDLTVTASLEMEADEDVTCFVGESGDCFSQNGPALLFSMLDLGIGNGAGEIGGYTSSIPVSLTSDPTIIIQHDVGCRGEEKVSRIVDSLRFSQPTEPHERILYHVRSLFRIRTFPPRKRLDLSLFRAEKRCQKCALGRHVLGPFMSSVMTGFG